VNKGSERMQMEAVSSLDCIVVNDRMIISE
jgi:hypothetical protein